MIFDDGIQVVAVCRAYSGWGCDTVLQLKVLDGV